MTKPEVGQVWYMTGGLWDERWEILKIHSYDKWTVKVVWGPSYKVGQIFKEFGVSSVSLKLEKSSIVKEDLKKLLD